MSAPVLANELCLLLRRPRLFVPVGISLAVWTFLVFIQWGHYTRTGGAPEGFRTGFYFFLGVGYFVFSIHATLIATRNMAKERNRDTWVFLKTAPLGPWSICLQKAGTPLVTEWLILFGLLPFVSLVLLVGGIGPGELAYQLVGLTVWLNTCVCIGLCTATQTRKVAHADRNGVGLVIVLAVLPIVVQSLSSVYTYLSAEIEHFTLVSTTLSWMNWVLHLLSPAWLIGSWNGESLFPNASSALGNEGLTRLFAICPALPSWAAHVALQVLLLRGATRAWKSGAHSERRGILPRIRKRLGGEAIQRGPFHLGWRTFYEQEDRALFKGGKKTKRRLQILLTVGTALIVLFLGGLVFVTVALGLVALTATMVLSRQSFGREIDRETGVFLLSSPARMDQVVLGKWLYYQMLGVRILLPGLVCAAPVFAFSFLWPEFVWLLAWLADAKDCLFCYFLMIAVVPLTAAIGIGLGLGAFGANARIIALLSLCCLPFGYFFWMLVSAGILTDKPTAHITESPLRNLLRVASASLCWVFSVTGFATVALQNTGIGPFLMMFHLFLTPPLLGMAIWHWLMAQSSAWWRKKLLAQTEARLAA